MSLMRSVIQLFILPCLLLVPVFANATVVAVSYTYDNIGRLISTSYTNAANSSSISYNYDPAGNLLASTVTGSLGTTNQPPAPTAPAITTASGTAGTSQIAANDPNTGDTFTYAISTAPTNGTATVSATGLATYTPNAAYVGPDSFVVTVTDNGTPQKSATVMVNVAVNTQASPIVAAELTQNITATSALLRFMVAPNGVQTSLSIALGTTINYGTTLNYTSTLLNGNATLFVQQQATNLVCGTLYHYQARVTNSNGASFDIDRQFTTLSCPVLNLPPVPTAAAITSSAGKAGASQITANDPNTGDTHTYTVSTAPTNGTATVNATGLATYTPNAAYVGADSFVVTVTDNGTPQKSGAATISVTVAASTTLAPTITGVSPATATVGVAQNYTISGSNLSPSMVGNIQGSVSHCAYVSGAGNSVVMNCVADVAGSKQFYLKTISGPTQPVISGSASILIKVASATLVDKIAPVITLIGGNVTIGQGATYSDAGATAVDNIDGNITNKITPVSTVNTSVIGTYTVTYNVGDAAGNPATQVTRTVNVVATVTTLNNGLVAHYQFEGNANDSSGNGNNGTAFGGVTYVKGVFGQGIKLNGVNSAGGTANPDHVMVPNSPSLQFSTAMSVSYWIRIDGNMSQTNANCSGASVPITQGSAIAKRGDRFGFVFGDYDTSSSFIVNAWSGGKGLSASNLTTSFQKFRHMTYVVNGQSVSMYVNGVLVKTATGVVDFATANLQDLYLGVAQNLNGACLKFWNPLDGVLDDVRIYNRALSAAEVVQLGVKTGGAAVNPLLMLNLGDVNGNGSGDFAVLGKRKSTGLYVVRVKDPNTVPHLIREIGLNGAYKPVQMVRLPDMNGNGSNEIAVLEVDPVTGLNRQIQVKDGRTGAKIVNIPLKASVKPHMLVVLPDVNGNGSPDLALSEVHAVTGKNVQIQVKDGKTGALIQNIRVSTSVKPHMLVSLGLINGVPALALSEVDAVTGKNVQIQVKNARTGAKIVNIRVKASVKPHMLVALPDVNGNGSPDLTLSEVDAVTGKNVQIQVKDGKTGALIQNIRVNTAVKPHRLLALPDLNANGSADLALSEVHASTGKNAQIQVKDGRTGRLIKNIRINQSVKPFEMVVVSDVNGNGSPELALLEVDAATGLNVQIQVKDAKTGAKVRNIGLNPNYAPLSMSRTRDSNGNGTQELGVLEQNAAGNIQMQIKDSLTGGLIKNQSYPKF